ncbi:MAG: InlB B-repeat-containing protein [Spirochaetaceae bacterium]|nr:InlB B-repeat-containing protein [Spirochaetaceae bacterium]
MKKGKFYIGIVILWMIVSSCDILNVTGTQFLSLSGDLTLSPSVNIDIGTTLSADSSNLAPAITPSYRWEWAASNGETAKWSAIEGARGSEYIVRDLLPGTYIRAVASADGLNGRVVSNVVVILGINGFTITYHLDGGTIVEGAEVPYSFTSKDDITLPDSASVKKPGFTFDGWYASDDGGEEAITGWEAGEKDGNVDVYAEWVEKTDYTLKFSMDSDIFSGSPPPDISNVSWTQADLLNGISDPEAIVGYTFAGWYTGENGQGINATNTKSFGEIAGNTEPDEGIITLYALFSNAPPLNAPSNVSLDASGTAHWKWNGTNLKEFIIQIWKKNSTADVPINSPIHVEASTGDDITYPLHSTLVAAAKAETDGLYHDYYITVTAVADNTLINIDSLASSASETQAVRKLILPMPVFEYDFDDATYKVSWDAPRADATENAVTAAVIDADTALSDYTENYIVQLYKNDVAVNVASQSPVTVSDRTAGVDFTSLIGTTEGTYQVKVQAIADTDYLFYDSEIMASSYIRVGTNTVDGTFESSDFPELVGINALVVTRNDAEQISGTGTHTLHIAEGDTLTITVNNASGRQWKIDGVVVPTDNAALSNNGNTLTFSTAGKSYGTHTVSLRAIVTDSDNNQHDCSASLRIQVQ